MAESPQYVCDNCSREDRVIVRRTKEEKLCIYCVSAVRRKKKTCYSKDSCHL